MNNKVIFLDVDGTLCNDEGFVPESAKEAVRSARKMDIRFIYVQDVQKLKFMIL